jgi:hypothetical protein
LVVSICRMHHRGIRLDSWGSGRGSSLVSR